MDSVLLGVTRIANREIQEPHYSRIGRTDSLLSAVEGHCREKASAVQVESGEPTRR